MYVLNETFAAARLRPTEAVGPEWEFCFMEREF